MSPVLVALFIFGCICWALYLAEKWRGESYTPSGEKIYRSLMALLIFSPITIVVFNGGNFEAAGLFVSFVLGVLVLNWVIPR